MNLVFVYGTLKRGGSNYHLLEASHGTKFAGVGRTNLNHYLIWGHGFTYTTVYPDGIHGAYVIGELFEVTDETLTRLDWLEGHPSHYCREQVPVRRIGRRKGSGDIYFPWMYLVPNDRLDDVSQAQFLEEQGGMYVDWRRAGARVYTDEEFQLLDH